MNKLNGIIIPAVTPFEEDGSLGIKSIEYNYRRWGETAVAGCMVLGSNGEFKSLSDDEAFQVIKIASETWPNDKVLIAGIGRESLHQTLEFLHRLEKAALRIDYISILTPHYFKKLMTDEALIGYYTAIADVSEYPVLIYCAPEFANNVCISADVIGELSVHPNIIGIKDTSKNMMTSYMKSVGGRNDFFVLAGSLGTIMTCMQLGGSGGIVSAANYFPNACAKLVAIAKNYGLDKAKDYHARLKELTSKTGGRAGVAGVKAVMNLMGYAGGVPRLPILPCSDRLINEFSETINQYGDLLENDII